MFSINNGSASASFVDFFLDTIALEQQKRTHVFTSCPSNAAFGVTYAHFFNLICSYFLLLKRVRHNDCAKFVTIFYTIRRRRGVVTQNRACVFFRLLTIFYSHFFALSYRHFTSTLRNAYILCIVSPRI